MQEVRHPDFEGLHLVPDPIGGAEIVQNCDLYKRAQLDSRHGYRHANHRRYNGGVVAIIDIQRICDYGKILVCSGWTPEDFIEVFEHEEGIGSGWGGPKGGPGGGGAGGGDPFWDKGFPPVAVANGNPLAGTPPLAVNFSSIGSFDPDGGPIVAYEWNFGDGNFSNLANPQHIYNAVGNYTARLTVTDSEGRLGTDTVGVAVSAAPVVGYTIFALGSGDSGAAPLGARIAGWNAATAQFEVLNLPSACNSFWEADSLAASTLACFFGEDGANDYYRTTPYPTGIAFGDSLGAFLQKGVGIYSRLLTRDLAQFYVMEQSPLNPLTLAVAADPRAGWVTPGVPGPYIGNALTCYAFQGGAVFMVSDGFAGGGGVARTINQGGAWTQPLPALLNITGAGMTEEPAGTRGFLSTTDLVSGGWQFRNTNDQGATWNLIYDWSAAGPPFGAWLGPSQHRCVALSPTVLVHSYFDAVSATVGIMRSADGGATWASVYTDPTRFVLQDIWQETTTGDLYALVGSGANGRIIRSQDAGASWAIWYDQPLDILGQGGTVLNTSVEGLLIAGGHR